MLEHTVLQGDVDLRELEIATGAVLRGLLPEGVPRFYPLGIRNRRPGQEVRAFWSVPEHGCGVRLIRDLEMSIVAASVECVSGELGTRVMRALREGLPSVSADLILENESRFEEMPELVFLLALATRHAPTDRVIAIVKRILMSSNENAAVLAAGAAALLDGDELLAAAKSAAAREDLSPDAKRVLQMSVRDIETHAAAWVRDKPFKDPEEVFRVRW